MIKETELRIGNLVYPDISYPEPMVVTKKDFDDPSFLNPIPLEKEHLLKLGFIKNRNHFVLNQNCSVTHEKTGSDKGFWYSNDDTSADFYRLKKIDFVHELQNLYFALTNEELRIT